MRRYVAFLITLILVFITFLYPASVNAKSDSEIAIIFTHDLHSHVQPFLLDGESVGGFARIKTVIDNIKNDYPNSITVDAGDFSMGTLYQTIFESSAIEYRLLSEMGYDAIAFGNHEFDYSLDSLLNMIKNGVNISQTSLPPFLCANIDVENSKYNYSQLDDYNVRKYSVFEKGNINIAVFGLMGAGASDYISADISFNDIVESAKETVEEIRSIHNPDVIICLSHSGTGKEVRDEDVKLAQKVEGIDVIVSAHTHTTLTSPIEVNGTYIVSAGEYGQYIGTIVLDTNKNNSLVSYKLNRIDSSVVIDENLNDKINEYDKHLNEYLNHFGFNKADDVIGKSDFDFPEQERMYDNVSEQVLGNLISDGFIYAVKQAEGDNYIPIDVATVPLGCIRTSIDKGDFTVAQAFEMLSLGIGPDGYSGYPLCSVYLYGSELWAIAEIDASVSGIMSAAQLYSSGLCYSVNTNRMLFNRVYDCWLVDDNGDRVEIIDDKLYRVVSCLEAAEMLGSVNDKSFGLLSLTPKDADGNPITDFKKTIITSPNGYEIKEWVALAQYVSSFSEENRISDIPDKYKVLDGRKNISGKISIYEIFTKWNYITWVVFAVVNILLLILVLVIIKIVKSIKKKRKSKSLKEINA